MPEDSLELLLLCCYCSTENISKHQSSFLLVLAIFATIFLASVLSTKGLPKVILVMIGEGSFVVDVLIKEKALYNDGNRR